MHRVLKPGGLLIGDVPETVPTYLVKKLLGLDLLSPPFHLRDYSPGTMKSFLEQAGFREVRVSPARPMNSPKPVENLLLKMNYLASRLLYAASFGWIMTPLGGKLAAGVK
jgi:hypothetical protein